MRWTGSLRAMLLLPALLLAAALAGVVGSGAWQERARAMDAETAQSSEAEVVGVLWQWQGTLLNDGTAFAPVDPSRYTLQLSAEGQAAVQADCNRGSGRYYVSDNRIVVGPLATTRALCPPGSLSDEYLRQLQDVTSYLTRDGELIMEIKFDSGSMRFSRGAAALTPAAAVTGAVTYRERIALPPDSVVTVQIQDTSRADAPAIVIGEQVIPTMGRQVPIPFSVSYDPAAIDPRFRYTLSVRITDGAGRLMWINMQSYPVITMGNPTSDVEVVVGMVR